MPPWTWISIADGSANGYRFNRDGAKVEFVYEPVTPEMSSSGFYSGGPARREALDAGDGRLSELWALLQRLEANPAVHVEDRAMGTGAIAWQSGEQRHEFIVAMGEELDGLLALLKRFGRE